MPKKRDFNVQQIIDLYINQKLSAAKIGKILNADASTILDVLKRNNIPVRNLSDSHRIHPVKHDFFDVIDTEEKAYFFGLLLTDGCNYEGPGIVKLALQAGDKHILQTLSDIIQPTKEVKQYKKPDPKHKDYCVVNIFSRQISQALAEKGIVANKTLITKFPTCIPDHLMNHFVRGSFDGDGSIKSKDGRIAFTGTKDYADKIADILRANGCNCTLYLDKCKSMLIYSLSAGGRIQVTRFLNWLYKDATVYIERKYEQYQKIKNFKSQVQLRREAALLEIQNLPL